MDMHVRRGDAFRMLFALLAMILGICHVHLAIAETLQAESFCGSFPEKMYLRAEPEPNAKTIGWIPPNTRLMLTKVNDKYAQTQYRGRTGYVHVGNVIMEDLTDQPIEKFAVFGEEPLQLFTGPYAGAPVAMVLQPFTPLEVVASNGTYWMGMVGSAKVYVPARLPVRLPPDEAVRAYEAYVSEPAVLLAYPLAGAQPIAVVGMSARLHVTAGNGRYALVENGEGKGYVLRGKLVRPAESLETRAVGYALETAPLYSSPELASYTQELIPAYGIVETDSAVNGFLRLLGQSAYVREDVIRTLKLRSTKATIGCWEKDEPLLRYDGIPLHGHPLVPANQLFEVTQSFGEYYLVKLGGTLGFVPIKGFRPVKDAFASQAVAAVVQKQTPLLVLPKKDSPQLSTTIPSGAGLWLGQNKEGFYIVRHGDSIGYVDASDLKVLGISMEAAPYEVYFEKQTVLLPFPSAGSAQTGAVASANSLGMVMAQVGDYLLVNQGSGEGYVARSDVWTLEQVESGEAHQQKYVLFLNKGNKEFSVYAADLGGQKTEQLLKSEIVAIGKRTTPTPSGAFQLGAKERWHYFGPSYAPFIITFAPGRYIHGPLFWTADEASIRPELFSEFGKPVTGGCIRIPYDMMLWIYYHCTGSNTTLEVVNGQ